MTALLGGHVEWGESNLTQADKVKAGQLKFLAIATEKRHPEVPAVPTLKEAGVNVVYAVNRGVLAPKGTPEPALARLEGACEKVSKESAFAESMRQQGTDVHFLGRKGYAEFLKTNDQLNKDLAAELGLLKRK
jgi:tripartite-type tricarboxylate transporter receptor subunit TctC